MQHNGTQLLTNILYSLSRINPFQNSQVKMKYKQATEHNSTQLFTNILHLLCKYPCDKYNLFQTCKAAHCFRPDPNIHLSFGNSNKFIDNDIFRNEVLQFLSGKQRKLQLTLCVPKYNGFMGINIDVNRFSYNHHIVLFGTICEKHFDILVKCNTKFILNVNHDTSRDLYYHTEFYQKMLHYIKNIKNIYPNCEIHLNWSRITKTGISDFQPPPISDFELPPISDIDGLNLSDTYITNKLVEHIKLPRVIDISNCNGITKINPSSFKKVKILKISLDYIEPDDIPSDLEELYILNEGLIKKNLYVNQFQHLTILYIYHMEVDICTWKMLKLRSLDLDKCTFSSYECIAHLKLLEELSIRRCNFGDTDIKHILDLPKLYKLDVSCGNNITDFSFIPQMNLEKLDVSDSNITNETLRYFKDLTNLNLTDTKITDLTMLGDRTMDSLMTLNLSYCNLLENWDVLLKLKFDTLYISHSSIKKIDPRWNAKKTIMHTPWN
jgi:hypothetical protein